MVDGRGVGAAIGSRIRPPSGNNAARLPARWDADSERAFVRKMNAVAAKPDMKNTTYTGASGSRSRSRTRRSANVCFSPPGLPLATWPPE
ncbi:hypothetical protein ACSDR0_23120 [Streptosporangium sp. G11]|uniref:hypothetical protein n=1 Tax=Streptosporangium sp. G11 TaxID=3436926 RepID=UPI003EBA6F23